MRKLESFGHYWEVPESKKVTCKMYELTDKTGYKFKEGHIPSDMEYEIHEGFTLGKGKTMYWMLTWHGSGNCTVYNKDGELKRRWIAGDTEITIHFQ